MVHVLTTKATGYHVLAEDYGEHWNLFLTLGMLQVLSALANIPPHFVLPAGEYAKPLGAPGYLQHVAVVSHHAAAWYRKLATPLSPEKRHVCILMLGRSYICTHNSAPARG